MRNPIKLRLIVCTMILFTSAFGINVFLNSSSVDRLYQESTISQYGAIGDYLKENLTEPLESGQKIDEIRKIDQMLAKSVESLKRVGLEQTTLTNIATVSRNRDILESVKNKLFKLFYAGLELVGIKDSKPKPTDINQSLDGNDKAILAISDTRTSPSTIEYAVSVALPNNVIAASSNRHFINRRLPDKTMAESPADEKKDKKASDFKHFKHAGLYYLTFPVHDANQNLLAEIALTIPEDRFNVNKHILIFENVAPLTFIFFGGIFILIAALNHMAKNRPDGLLYSKNQNIFYGVCRCMFSPDCFFGCDHRRL